MVSEGINPRKIEILKTVEGQRFQAALDVGVGEGRTLHGIDAARKVGLDIWKRVKYDGIEYLNFDLETINGGKRLPFRNDYFDVVVSEDVFEHLQGFVSGKLLKEIARVMKPGGVLIGTIPNHFYVEIRLKYLFGDVSSHHIFKNEDSHLSNAFLTAKGLKKKFSEFFEVEKCDYGVGHLKTLRPAWFAHSIVFKCRKNPL